MNQFPKAPEYPIRVAPFRIFRKFVEIFTVQCAQTLMANLPPVSLILEVHLDLQIFEKIGNYPNVIFRGLGEEDS
jgi:hypothetical protein